MWEAMEHYTNIPKIRAKNPHKAFNSKSRCWRCNVTYAFLSSESLAVSAAISPMLRRMSSRSLGSSQRSAIFLASPRRALMFSSPSGPPWGSASQFCRPQQTNTMFPNASISHPFWMPSNPQSCKYLIVFNSVTSSSSEVLFVPSKYSLKMFAIQSNSNWGL